MGTHTALHSRTRDQTFTLSFGKWNLNRFHKGRAGEKRTHPDLLGSEAKPTQLHLCLREGHSVGSLSQSEHCFCLCMTSG